MIGGELIAKEGIDEITFHSREGGFMADKAVGAGGKASSIIPKREPPRGGGVPSTGRVCDPTEGESRSWPNRATLTSL